MTQTVDTRRAGGKSEAAFRTISEVADELDVPQHVLRFWETKFTQIRPMKRGGGRRYYRPDDVALLKKIRALLYVDGFTIKGVQKLLREGSVPLKDDESVAVVPAASHPVSPLSPLEEDGQGEGDGERTPVLTVSPVLLPEDEDDGEGTPAVVGGDGQSSGTTASVPAFVSAGDAGVLPAGGAGFDPLLALELKKQSGGLDETARATLGDVIAELCAVRDLLSAAVSEDFPD